MRRNIEETPAFARLATAADRAGRFSLQRLRLAARAFGFTILWTVSYYIVLSYMPTFLQKQVGLAATQALWTTAAGLLVAGSSRRRCSDWCPIAIGRKPLLLAACIGFLLLPYPLFSVLLSLPSLATVISVQLILALTIAVFSGPGPAAIAEIFPTAVRSTWMSTGYSVAVAMFGGFAPFIATWLIARTGNPIAPELLRHGRSGGEHGGDRGDRGDGG